MGDDTERAEFPLNIELPVMHSLSHNQEVHERRYFLHVRKQVSK